MDVHDALEAPEHTCIHTLNGCVWGLVHRLAASSLRGFTLPALKSSMRIGNEETDEDDLGEPNPVPRVRGLLNAKSGSEHSRQY